MRKNRFTQLATLLFAGLTLSSCSMSSLSAWNDILGATASVVSPYNSSSNSTTTTTSSSGDVATRSNVQPTPAYATGIDTDSSSRNGANLENSYRKWENRARSNYNSLTNLGTRTKKNGKDSKGSTDQSMNTSAYTSMKSSLREAQREMANIRRTAASQGITIVKSEYEDIQVSY